MSTTTPHRNLAATTTTARDLEGASDLLSALDGGITTARSQMFRDFCQTLEEHQISYAILSGYRSYPDHIDSDIDFIVSEADFQRLAQIFAAPDCIRGAKLIQFLRHETSACYFVFAKQVGSRLAYLHPDAAASYRRRGRLWLKPEQVLPNRRRSPSGFWVPAPATEFEYYYVKRVDKGIIERRHLEGLAGLLRDDPEACRRVLELLAPENSVHEIERAIGATDTHWFNERMNSLRMALNRSAAREGVIRRLKSGLGDLVRMARRIIHPTGFVVAVLGPDGSGKTTVIEHLERELAPAFRRVRRFHLRPHFGATGGDTPVTDPHAQPPRGRLASAAKVALFLLDYWLGWLRWVQPAKVRSSLVIFDRSYHDMLVDPVRYRLPPGFLLARLFASFLPKPDIWLVLHAPPEVLVARKGEISLATAQTLSAGYSRLARQLDAHLVNTGRGLEATLAEVLRIPLDRLAARTRQRLGLTR